MIFVASKNWIAQCSESILSKSGPISLLDFFSYIKAAVSKYVQEQQRDIDTQARIREEQIFSLNAEQAGLTLKRIELHSLYFAQQKIHQETTNQREQDELIVSRINSQLDTLKLQRMLFIKNANECKEEFKKKSFIYRPTYLWSREALGQKLMSLTSLERSKQKRLVQQQKQLILQPISRLTGPTGDESNPSSEIPAQLETCFLHERIGRLREEEQASKALIHIVNAFVYTLIKEQVNFHEEIKAKAREELKAFQIEKHMKKLITQRDIFSKRIENTRKIELSALTLLTKIKAQLDSIQDEKKSLAAQMEAVGKKEFTPDNLSIELRAYIQTTEFEQQVRNIHLQVFRDQSSRGVLSQMSVFVDTTSNTSLLGMTTFTEAQVRR